MNSIVKKSIPGTGNSLSCELRKKPNRKRHRNKSRNLTLKKKKIKKFHGRKKSAPTEVNALKLDCMSTSNQIMSNWYWSNYRKAVEWQDKHRTAYWKACALALYEENRNLLQIINQLHPGMHPEVSVTQNISNKGLYSGKGHKNLNQCSDSANICNYVNANDDNYTENANDVDEDDEDDDEETNDIEFELSEEMMEFFEQSYKHKMELKELKEKELLHKAEDEVKQMQSNKIKRSTEMNLLYGDGASMITGMETAVQLSFEKYCDTKSPKYWPNIPFRL